MGHHVLSKVFRTASSVSARALGKRHSVLISNHLSNYSRMSTTAKLEAAKRNPHGVHPDFKKIEASRPDWDKEARLRVTKAPNPSWSLGDGANRLYDPSDAEKNHICLDPHESGRPSLFNYKLLISGIIPRPIGFVSTQSSDGRTRNLAPFSDFNLVNHDPPLFVIGISAPLAKPNDTLRNLVDTRECVVNIISEHFIEAANAASVDAPYGVSEWAISGLTPAHDCVDVRPPRVREAVFSVECKLESVREFESRARPGTMSGCLVVLEGTRFWVREDALNEDQNMIDPDVLRPMARLGGISYARVRDVMEVPRPRFEENVGGIAGYEKLKGKRNGDGNGST
ncbi:hypothetical protein F5Y04DRAFT_256420 [Hypomontagnella monticulosa]|nr:hypothetical protein F5Y04DRAFT_256420 [Hypomontagnella monticulosa]